MEFYEVLQKRRTIRDFTGQVVSDELHSLNFFASAWAAFENIFLAATAEGLATCLHIPMGDEVEQINRVIGSPEGYELTCLLAIGYPAYDAHICRQVQIDIHDRIHENKW